MAGGRKAKSACEKVIGKPRLVTGTDVELLPARAKTHPKLTGDYAARVQYIAELMASGGFSDPSTVRRELQETWNLSYSSLLQMCAESSRLVRCSVDRVAVAMRFSDSMDTLARLAAEAEREGERREAIFCHSKIAELCAAIMRAQLPDTDNGQRGKSATERLVAAGWTPPPTIPGLPAPTVMGPPTIESLDTKGASSESPEQHQNGNCNDDHEAKHSA